MRSVASGPTPEVIEAFAACAKHPTGLIPHAVILDRTRGLIPWADWPHLRTLLDDWTRQKRSVVLKSRQLGVSWAAALFALWTAKFQPGANVLMLSQGQSEAADLLEKCRVLESNFPAWLRYGRGKDNDSELEFPVMNSRIVALPSTERAGRSNQGTLVILDEFAFHAYAAESLTALLPTVGDAGQLIVVSTANGVGGPFWQLWTAARDRAFAPIFIGWDARPDRDAAWYAARAVELGATLTQEYPRTADEAFLQSGRPVFPGVERDRDLAPLPDARKPRAVPAETIVYRLPTAGHRYVIGADVALGKAHSDHSCAVVLELDDFGQGVEAAHLCGLWPPDLFALYLDSLSQFYGARLAVERNNHGVAVLDYLRQLIADRQLARSKAEPQRYTLHHSQDPLKAPTAAGAQPTKQTAGWWTSQSSKAMMILELEAALRTRLLRFGTPELLAELQAYQRADDGTMDAPEGQHDDRVIALAIAWQMHKWAVLIPRPRRPLVNTLYGVAQRV